jgi:hypothetical protein
MAREPGIQIRKRAFLDPGSAAHRFALRRARDDSGLLRRLKARSHFAFMRFTLTLSLYTSGSR